MSELVKNYSDLRVYQQAMETAMQIFLLTKNFPSDEKFSLVDQIRRSSRSVCANLAEAWRKRRYKPAFIAKLSDAETEAGETQVWLEFAYKCNYINEGKKNSLTRTYEHIIAQVIRMIEEADRWIIRKKN